MSLGAGLARSEGVGVEVACREGMYPAVGRNDGKELRGRVGWWNGRKLPGSAGQ